MKFLKWSSTHLLLAGLILSASWLRFPNFLFGCVDYLERAFFSLAGYSRSAHVDPNLRIIYIEERGKDDPWYFGDEEARLKWRARHAKLVGGLAQAGARIIAFDFAFPDPSPFDKEFAGAIRNAGATRVILGYEPVPGQPQPAVSPTLAAVLGPDQISSVKVGGERKDYGGSFYRYIKLSESRSIGSATTSSIATFPLQIKLVWESQKKGAPVTALVNEVRSRVVLRAGTEQFESIPCRIQRQDDTGGEYKTASLVLNMVEPVELDAISKPYNLVQKWIDEEPENLVSNYKGRIVLVGVQMEKEKFQVGPDQTPFGYRIHASVVSNLLQGGYPRELGIVGQMTVLFLLCLGAGITRVAVPGGHRPMPIQLFGREWNLPLSLIFLLGSLVVVTVLIYNHAQIHLDIVYQASALVAGYYVTGWVLSGSRRSGVRRDSGKHRKEGAS
ncbi:MAG: CHASE2 domain-containing protein [Acidobacteriia bacterium]|nr:CHASE2 domain-containing protein [Terriglobia bacterium]